MKMGCGGGRRMVGRSAGLVLPAVAALLAGCGSSGKPSTVRDGSPDATPDAAQDRTTASDAGADSATKEDAAHDGSMSTDGPPALPACSSLPNALYVMSGDTQVPILKVLGKALRNDSSPVTLVWQSTGSCTIIEGVFAGTPLKQNLSYIPADPAWDPVAGTVPTCTPDAAGAPVQLGIPIVYPASCTSTPAPSSVMAYKGPVQSMVFIVPKASTAQAISAEEAYLVFGFGAAGGVTPWIDPTLFFIRPATKGTQVSLGALIGVPAAKWQGQPIDQSTNVAAMVAASTSPNATIGILGAEIYDSAANRAALRSLSFQGYGQTGGYFPDTTVAAFDKRNVRDGHYLGWSHVFYLTTVDASGYPTDTRAARVIDILTGAPTAAPPAGVNPLVLVASEGLVPNCAMNVERTAEGGPLSTYLPPAPCGCFYESTVGTAPASCVACTADPGCGAGQQCLHGFCEAANGRTTLTDCASAPATDSAIPNNPCTGRTIAPQLPQPQKEIDNGGTLPPLP